MEYTTLGDTGLTISKICLGCMSFQEDSTGWAVDRETSVEIIERAIDLGINFFDTGNVYAGGESEQILGDALAGYDPDWPVVSTKINPTSGPAADTNPNGAGLSRKAIDQALANSLNRLGMEAVDLYQIHRWDPDTPIEETLRALDDAVRRNQVRYIGASSMWAYQFATALHTSTELGLERFVSMQNHYNLVYREEERDMLPLCQQEGIGVFPWSPLARGYLAFPHEEYSTTVRGSQETDADTWGEVHDIYRSGGGREINERVEQLAKERGVSMAQIALAWQFHKEWITAPTVGATSVDHLEEAVEALDISLSESDIAYLEEPYEPSRVHPVFVSSIGSSRIAPDAGPYLPGNSE